MNHIRKFALAALALVVGGIVVAYCGHRFAEASRQLTAAEGRFAAALQQINRINVLRAQSQRVELHARPKEDVLALVNAVLAESGIPGQHLRSFSNEGEGMLDPTRSEGIAVPLRRQSMKLSLHSVTLPQLGRFLIVWRQTQQTWTPARLELLHGTGRDAGDRYDVALVISAIYVEEDGRT